MEKPLAGIRVVDFTWVRAGPWATRWLAALGAVVIKVEAPDAGRNANTMRVSRELPQGVPPGPNSSGIFNDSNAGKLGITLNMRSARGLDLAKQLIAISDVVIENYATGVLSGWGLSYDEMVRVSPGIIYVSMAGPGHLGRDSHYKTNGPIVQALSGLTFLSGLPGEPPAGWGWSYMDDTGGMYGVMAVLTALHYRNRTGEGQHVDLAQIACGMTLSGPALLDLIANKRGSERPGYPPGNRAVWPGTALVSNYRGPTVVPHNAYRTAGDDYNSWCVITCLSDGEWLNLVRVMGSPPWATASHLSTVAGRIEHQLEVDTGVESWTRTLDKYEVMRRCQEAGVPAMPVQSNEDRVEHDPQLRHQQMYRPLPHAVLGMRLMQNFPFTLSAVATPVERSAPLLGEHNAEVLSGLLGLTASEIAAGYEDGTFWSPDVPLEPYLLPVREIPRRDPGSTLESRVGPAVEETGIHSAGALGDLRVLELSDERGQWCGKLLADMGADVIRIEAPGGAAERRVGPFLGDEADAERSLSFWHYNTSKRGITLDLETDDGRSLFRRLVASADVVLETFRPGYLDSLGIGYEAIRSINPRIVMCSLTDFGQTGPWRDYRASDLAHLAAGGQMASCGYDDDDVADAPPIAPGGGNAWHIGGHYAYIAIMAAICMRDTTHVGQYIDASVHGACALTTEGAITTWIYTRQVLRRHTGRHASPGPSPRTQFLCKDGKYFQTGGRRAVPATPAQLRAYAEWMDTYGLAGDLLDPKYEDPVLVTSHEEHIMELVEQFFARLTAEEAYRGTQERGFPTGAVRTPEEYLRDPHWQDRGFFVEVAHPEVGTSFTYPGAAAIYSRTPWRISRRAPLVGEHNMELYGELGESAESLQALRESGVI